MEHFCVRIVLYNLHKIEGINIKIGYVRGMENSRTYKTQMDFLNNSNVERIFHEKNADNIAL